MSIEPRAFAGSAAADAADAAGRERRLVEAVLRKDRKAAADLISAHADAIYSYVRHRLTPRLEQLDDIVQEVFIAAFAGLHAFRGTSSLRSWLLGIARHKIEDVYRQRLRRDQLMVDGGEIADVPDEGEPVDDHIDRSRAARRTQRILAQLPETYSAVLLWRYWESRSVREIAEATGRTEKSIERLLARARSRFREIWQGDER